MVKDIRKRGNYYSISLGGVHGGLELGGNSLLLLLSGELEVSEPLLALGVLLDSDLTWGHDLSDRLSITLGLGSIWLGNDLGVNLLVELLAGLDLVGGEALVPLGELSLELLGVFLLELVHVGGNVNTEDVLSVDLSVEGGIGLLGVGLLSSLVGDDLDSGLLVAWESLGLVWHVEATVTGTLEGSEESGTGGGSLKTDIKEGLEWSLVSDIVVNVEVLSVDISVLLVHLGESDSLEESSGDQETGAVGSGVVGETSSDTVLLELGGLSSTEDLITSHGGVDDLGDELGASSSDDKSVLLGVVLVLILVDKSSSGIVVGLTLSSSLWLDLHSLVVCFVLNYLYETHCM